MRPVHLMLTTKQNEKGSSPNLPSESVSAPMICFIPVSSFLRLHYILVAPQADDKAFNIGMWKTFQIQTVAGYSDEINIKISEASVWKIAVPNMMAFSIQ